MNYIAHEIEPTGRIFIIETGNHRTTIEPNQPLTKYKSEIETDTDFAKYRTAENARDYEKYIVEEEPTLEEKLQHVENNRRNAYQNEADPLFLKWQRGEATEQEWLDKIADIKERFPKPEK